MPWSRRRLAVDVDDRRLGCAIPRPQHSPREVATEPIHDHRDHEMRVLLVRSVVRGAGLNDERGRD